MQVKIEGLHQSLKGMKMQHSRIQLAQPTFAILILQQVNIHEVSCNTILQKIVSHHLRHGLYFTNLTNNTLKY